MRERNAMKAACWIHRSHLLRPDEYICPACKQKCNKAYHECPVCGARMKKGRDDLTWIDEAEELSAILDDDW